MAGKRKQGTGGDADAKAQAAPAAGWTSMRLRAEVHASLSAAAEDMHASLGEAVGVLAEAYLGGMELAGIQAQRDALRAEVAGLHAELEEERAARATIARQAGVSQAALDLLVELRELGASGAEVLEFGRAMVAAEVEPALGAQRMRELGGLLGWMNQLRVACERGAVERDRSFGEAAQARQEAEGARQEAARAQQAVALVASRVQEAQDAARRVAGAAHEFGIYVDEFLTRPGGPVDTWPLGVARVMAGAILYAALQSHGRQGGEDVRLKLPQSGLAGRFIPADVLLSEVPFLLAPPEAYQAMAQAGGGGPQGPPPPAAPPAGPAAPAPIPPPQPIPAPGAMAAPVAAMPDA